MISQPFKIGLIFTLRYDEDRDKRKKWDINSNVYPIQEWQYIN